LVAWLGYGIIGTGSALFHASLQYEMQLIDELGMIYTTSIMSYAMYSYNQSTGVKMFWGFGFLFLNIFITAYYHYLRDPSFHQMCFTIMIISVTFRTVVIRRAKIKPPLRVPDSDGNVEVDGVLVPVEEQRSRDLADYKYTSDLLVSSLIAGVGSFLVAFVLWTIDNNHCSLLISWRRKVGLPWGIFLELHGYW
jgi:dihydroceramidase